MGGAVVLLMWGATVAILAALRLLSREGLFLIAAAALFGAIGAFDDLLAQRRRRSLGLSPLQKIGLATGVSVLLFLLFPDVGRGPVWVPFTAVRLPIHPAVSLLLSWFVFVGTTNSMNLTDGLDGLASGVSVLILVGFLAIEPGAGIARAALPLIGVLVGFLWVNGYPARLFLGDVGAFALGGAVAAALVATGSQFLLPLLAGLLVLEAVSVILQMTWVRLTGTRLLRMSPLHHHFECTEGPARPHVIPSPEWPEPTIVLRLWILQAGFVGLAIVAALRWSLS